MARAKTKTITPFGKSKPIKIKKGALTRQAKAKGQTVSQFCKGKKKGVTARRCGLAKAFKTMRNRKKA